MALVDFTRERAERKEATPAQIALAWLLARRPWIVPISGTTNGRHLDEDLGALTVEFAPEELREFNASLARIEIHGERLRQELLVVSGREAPPKWNRPFVRQPAIGGRGRLGEGNRSCLRLEENETRDVLVCRCPGCVLWP